MIGLVKIQRERLFGVALVLATALLLTSGASKAFDAHRGLSQTQESFPAPPADRSRIYIFDEKNVIEPLPFEAGKTPLQTNAVASNDRVSYIQIEGAHGATVINNSAPRFFLYSSDQPNTHPPFIVRLTEKRGTRRVMATVQKGFRGFAIVSEEIIKPIYRVLQRADGLYFMEVRAREPLMPGEYAFIGADLARIATFRISAASNP